MDGKDDRGRQCKVGREEKLAGPKPIKTIVFVQFSGRIEQEDVRRSWFGQIHQWREDYLLCQHYLSPHFVEISQATLLVESQLETDASLVYAHDDGGRGRSREGGRW